MAHESDESLVQRTRSSARFFVENRHVAWVLLVLTLAWGVFGYRQMPKRKDPHIPIRVGAVVCPWPGMTAERVEERVTRRLERKIAENGRVERILATTRNSVAVLVIVLDPTIVDVDKELEDIRGKLSQVTDLPEGAGPIQFLKDFKDTSALMLTVASPVVPPVEISLRADALRKALAEARADATGPRAALVVSFPHSLEPVELDRLLAAFPDHLRSAGLAADARVVRRPGFLAVDAAFPDDDARFLAAYRDFVRQRMSRADVHPDVWEPAVVRDPADAEARLTAVAGPRYTYRDLDAFSETISRALIQAPEVAKAVPVGVLPEAVYLTWDPDRLAANGLQPSALPSILGARNTPIPGGVLEAGDRNVVVEPSGEFRSEAELGNVMVGASPGGAPLYLRDLFDIRREYQSPPRFLNFFRYRDADGQWRRTRAVTLSVLMKDGRQIADFGVAVDGALDRVRAQLPDDLVLARTSDQPLQVRENVDLFMRSLMEAVVLIVIVAFLGFREWRSATLMALSIPLTLAMTFGLMNLLGIDLQQVSIASLIIALGLLVDVPVVAGDAIKREIAAGHASAVAAWLGPHKLANAILFATLTNIAAYLPLLLMDKDIGRFIYSLPVVITCSLGASFVVAMTFVPLLGFHLLRAKDGGRDPRAGRLGRVYRATVGWAIDHRWKVAIAMTLVLAGSAFVGSRLKTSFFPTDLSYLFYVDVWTPEDSSLASTGETTREAERVILETAAEFARTHPDPRGSPRDVLRSMTTFVGGGGPRFWFSILPEMQQLNYAQIIVWMEDKHDTEAFVGPLQQALGSRVPGARVDVRRLETAMPVGVPVAFRLVGDDLPTLRAAAERLKGILREVPTTDRVRDDWGAETLALRLDVDADRANLSGLTNLDVALSSVSGVSGFPVAKLADGHRSIPVSIRLRPEARADLTDLSDFTVYSVRGAQRVPLRAVASPSLVLEPEKILRRNQSRTITVSAFPVAGVLPSQVMNAVRPRLDEVRASLPPGHRLEIGGEEEEQVKSFRQVAVVMVISVLMIYLMLMLEFRNAIKPLVVFAAIPFGVVGGLAALWIAGAPFGFMAFLGIASLIGVIVSHVIVLFDFIEVLREQGASLREALADAGIVRLRPVLITVGATVLGLFPLALNGGPLWEPLCWAQIGGLTIATVVTLLIVPVLYAIFVLDLRLVKWEGPATAEHGEL